ncbi:hypothetical protein J5N97_004950 [Dioscorea zingiberensis]|uniref:Uncharacterized protein n=1 Tax=Dioscorea zingiberensis TaxID=325984 RepID=A0A9D5D867_9LILI|nr:hypothetical protein J5N97_004950 [Dioscorea zingiberensis]
MAEMEFTTKELLEAQAHVWNLMLSYLKSMCLKSAVELGIADVLKNHGKPMELSDLMSALSISPSRTDSFRRFMRTLTHIDLFAEKLNPGHEVKYVLTPSSHLLVSGETMNVIPLASLEADPMLIGPSQVIGPWFKSPKATSFELFFSKGVWEMASERPEFNKTLNEGIASATRVVCDVVIMTCGQVFRGLKSLVDVGGGTGTMARSIARAFPEIKCTVLDLPHVVDTLKEDSVVEYVGGDMFVSVPPANAVLLKWILHDWNDEECVKILQRCKEAIPIRDEGGKIIIIDMVMDATIDKHTNAVETQLYFDLLMMIHTTGKERNESEWQNIFLVAGFNKYKITPCGDLQSIIELYP